MPKLTDTQLVILSAAAARGDSHILPLPDTLKARGGAVTSCLKSLLKKGLVDEYPAKAREPTWREEDDKRYGLRITREGLDAIGMDCKTTSAEAEAVDTDRSRKAGSAVPSGRSAKCQSADAAKTSKPSPGSKRAILIGMLSKPKGASVPRIQRSLGWLPHTVRAAITGLRKQGYAIDRHKGDDGTSIYRIVGQPGVQDGGAARS